MHFECDFSPFRIQTLTWPPTMQDGCHSYYRKTLLLFCTVQCVTCLQNIQKFIGDKILQKLINFALRYMSELVLPCKR